MKDGKLLADILGAKFGTKNRSELIMRTEQLQKAVKDILWMARRYADGRKTYAPSMFNDAYDVLREELGDVLDENHAQSMGVTYYDISIETSKHHPYAKYGYDNEDSQENLSIKNRKFYKKP